MTHDYMKDPAGTMDGNRCNRDGCLGIIELTPVENCSCHISPPCAAHEAQHPHCPDCGWDSDTDP